MGLLNQLWHLVNLRKNYLLPTVKTVGWRETKAGRKARIYEKPATPHQRLATTTILDKVTAAHAGSDRRTAQPGRDHPPRQPHPTTADRLSQGPHPSRSWRRSTTSSACI